MKTTVPMGKRVPLVLGANGASAMWSAAKDPDIGNEPTLMTIKRFVWTARRS